MLNPIVIDPAPPAPSGAAGSTPRTSTAADRFNPDMFLQLLVAQMRTQNPLEPMQATEFMAQLAQFNTLEQMIAMRTELRAIREATERQAAGGAGITNIAG